jgi:tetratricopeptide (TPR) repeat protein
MIDLFLCYDSRERDAVNTVREHLARHGISTFYDRQNLTPGKLWVEEIERALSEVGAIAVFIGRHGLGTIQKREWQFALARQSNEADFSIIPILLDGADPDAVSGFLTLFTWVDLRGRREDPEAVLPIVHSVRRRSDSSAQRSSQTSFPCPYRALQAFREEDAQLFFGREQYSSDLFDLVCATHFVAIVGPSGSGKSSLVQAGLLPQLRLQREPAYTWDEILFSPGSEPFFTMAQHLAGLWSASECLASDIDIEARQLASKLMTKDLPLSSLVDRALSNLDYTNRLLIIVDQFEELFTLTASYQQQSAFIEQLLDVANASKATVIITLRADFYGSAIEHRPLADRLAAGHINLGPLTPEELERSIRLPALKVGMQWEPELVERILDDVGQQPGNLPLMQFALSELWHRHIDGKLTHAAYRQLGRVHGAIAQQADNQLSALQQRQKIAARRLFCRLVRVSAAGEEGADTRAIVYLDQLNEDQVAVARLFSDARLLVYGRDSRATVEVAHEALIRHWGILKTWLEGDRDFLLWRQRLAFFIREWERTGKDDDNLLRGSSLQEAKRWLQERAEDLSASEIEFISAGTTAVHLVRRIVAQGHSLWPFVDVQTLCQWLSSLTSLGDIESFQRQFPKISEPAIIAAVVDSIVKIIFTMARPERMMPFVELCLSTVGRVSPGDARDQICARLAEALGRLNYDSEALALCREIDNRPKQSSALIQLARVLAEKDRHGEAFAVAEAIGEAEARQDCILEVASRLSRIPMNPEIARTALRLLEDLSEPQYANTELLSAAIRLCALNGLIDEALAAIAGIENRSLQSDLLCSIIPELALGGRINHILSCLPTLQNGSKLDLGLAKAAKALAENGSLADALSLKAHITDAALRADVLSIVTKVLIDRAQSEDARHLLDEQLALINRLTDQGTRSGVLSTVAREISRLSDRKAGRVLALQIPDIVRRNEVLTDIARQATRNNCLEEALDIILEVKSTPELPTLVDRARASLGTTFIELGHIRAGEQLLSTINDVTARVQLTGQIARSLARSGQIDRALAVARQLEQQYFDRDDHVKVAAESIVIFRRRSAMGLEDALRRVTGGEFRCQLVHAIALKLAQQNEPKDALTLCPEIEDQNVRDGVLAIITEAFAALGSGREAVDTLRTIREWRLKQTIATAILKPLVRKGQFSAVPFVIATIDSDSQRARAWGDVSEAHCNSGLKAPAAEAALKAMSELKAAEFPDPDLVGRITSLCIRTGSIHEVLSFKQHLKDRLAAKQSTGAVSTDALSKSLIRVLTSIGLEGARPKTEQEASELKDEVLTTFEGLTTGSARRVLIAQVGALLAGLDYADDVVALAKEVPNTNEGDKVILMFISFLADAGRFSHCSALIAQIPDHFRREQALAHFGRKLGAADQIEKACEVLNRLKGASLRNDVLSDLASKCAERGDARRALEFCLQITARRERLELLQIITQNVTLDFVNFVGSGERTAFGDEVLGSVVHGAILRDNVLVACAALDMIKDPGKYVTALNELALLLVKIGEGHELRQRVKTLLGQLCGTKYQRPAVLRIVVQLMTRCGDVDRAVTLVDRLADVGKRSELTSVIAEVLADQGQYAKAVAVSSKIKEEHVRTLVLAKVAAIAATTGEVELAWQVAGSIGNAIPLSILRELAEKSADNGLGGEVVAYIDKITEISVRMKVLEELASILAKIGYGSEVRDRVLKVMSVVSPQPQMVETAVVILTKVGSVDDALTLVEGSSNNSSASRLVARMCSILTQNGRFESAMAIVQKHGHIALREFLLDAVDMLATGGYADHALQAASRVESEFVRPRALARIAQRMWEMNMLVERQRAAKAAVQSLAGISDPAGRDGVAQDVAQMLAEAACPKEALAGWEHISRPQIRRKVLGFIASGLSRAGCDDDAIAVAMSLTGQVSRVEVLVHIADVMAEGGRLDGALKALKAVGDAVVNSQLVSKAALALARSGRGDEAMKVAQRIEEQVMRTEVLIDIGGELVKRGDWDAAREAIEEARNCTGDISQYDRKSDMLSRISKIYSSLHLYDEAFSVCQGCDRPTDKLQGYIGIITAYSASKPLAGKELETL